MLARTPNLDRFYDIYPHTSLKCSGEAVGLPEGQMGNSEVGHLNMGAGRIVYQELTRITKSIWTRPLPGSRTSCCPRSSCASRISAWRA